MASSACDGSAEHRRLQRQRACRNDGAGVPNRREHGGEIQAPVCLPVRPEPAGRLLELPGAADAVPASGLVPGDGNVDESLQEVTLLGLRCAPGALELLVRLEVPAGPDQLQTRLEVIAHLARLAGSSPRPTCAGAAQRRLPSEGDASEASKAEERARGGTWGFSRARGFPRAYVAARLAPVATILLVGVDLFFRGKLDVLLPGHRLVTTDTIAEPEVVIADISRVEPEEVADTYPDVPLVGFSSHTDTAGLRRAHAAGFDQVLAKSALQERCAEVIEELLAPVE